MRHFVIIYLCVYKCVCVQRIVCRARNTSIASPPHGLLLTCPTPPSPRFSLASARMDQANFTG